MNVYKYVDDLTVIIDFSQYNFNGLDDLSGNINSKIEFEQNKILEILTALTAYISQSTIIAGVCEMNFK